VSTLLVSFLFVCLFVCGCCCCMLFFFFPFSFCSVFLLSFCFRLVASDVGLLLGCGSPSATCGFLLRPFVFFAPLVCSMHVPERQSTVQHTPLCKSRIGFPELILCCPCILFGPLVERSEGVSCCVFLWCALTRRKKFLFYFFLTSFFQQCLAFPREKTRKTPRKTS
jgi:hypothetical protein